jgi:hypothetical protein
MGFRTPTTVLSPYTQGVGISNAGPFGHESILKLIEQRFAFAPLCKRDQFANSIGESFNWAANPNADPPTLPDPAHIVSKPCSMGGGDITDGGVHAGDMDGLEELAHRVGVPVGEGKPHQIFGEPSKVQTALPVLTSRAKIWPLLSAAKTRSPRTTGEASTAERAENVQRDFPVAASTAWTSLSRPPKTTVLPARAGEE